MYPNIILTYRLQPTAIVSADTCAACDFNEAGNRCQLATGMWVGVLLLAHRAQVWHVAGWTWRGDYIPASAAEVRQVRNQIEVETFPAAPLVPGVSGDIEDIGGGGGGGGGGRGRRRADNDDDDDDRDRRRHNGDDDNDDGDGGARAPYAGTFAAQAGGRGDTGGARRRYLQLSEQEQDAALIGRLKVSGDGGGA
jgi:hypothetical protein